MTAVAAQPVPRRSRIGLLARTLQGAWRTALAVGQPPMIRARALAVVLVAVLALGSFGGAVTLAAAGALDLFGPHPLPTPLLHPRAHDPPDS